MEEEMPVQSPGRGVAEGWVQTPMLHRAPATGSVPLFSYSMIEPNKNARADPFLQNAGLH